MLFTFLNFSRANSVKNKFLLTSFFCAFLLSLSSVGYSKNLSPRSFEDVKPINQFIREMVQKHQFKQTDLEELFQKVNYIRVFLKQYLVLQKVSLGMTTALSLLLNLELKVESVFGENIKQLWNKQTMFTVFQKK